MRYIILLFFISLITLFANGQQITVAQNEAQLAASFYNAKEYEKAAKLYIELYEKTNLTNYFDNYIDCLFYSEKYEDAIKALKKELRKRNTTNLEIDLGRIYKQMGDLENASETFDKVINNLSSNIAVVIATGNEFANNREFEYAEKTYLRGRQILPGEMFHRYLGNIYAYMRDYAKMTEEFIMLVKEDEKNTILVESMMSSLLRNDFDGSLKTIFRNAVLAKIQENPEITAYSRLLIWYFITEKDYLQAINNTIALDRRTKTEENNILTIAGNATEAQEYDTALKGINYLISRKQAPSNINVVLQEKVRTEYQKFINTPPKERINSADLKNEFEGILSNIGYNVQTSSLIIQYAHFLAFYLREPDYAIEVINKGLEIRELNNSQRSLLSLELADIKVFDNKLWEATLEYARIIDQNKQNSIGDEAKLRKAKLSYYLGDIVWSRGQLDALKASTSKLIANDAMELSLLISANYDLDSIEEPIQMFARGDLHIFQNNDSLAELTYDSIMLKYPYHSLSDKILMRKGKIAEKRFEFEDAIKLYAQIVKEFRYSSSADDAIYRQAIIQENKMNNKSIAQELYREIITEFPGSIYVADSRNRYRILRGDYPTNEEPIPYEDNFFNNL